MSIQLGQSSIRMSSCATRLQRRVRSCSFSECSQSLWDPCLGPQQHLHQPRSFSAPDGPPALTPCCGMNFSVFQCRGAQKQLTCGTDWVGLKRSHRLRVALRAHSLGAGHTWRLPSCCLGHGASGRAGSPAAVQMQALRWGPSDGHWPPSALCLAKFAAASRHAGCISQLLASCVAKH